MANTSSCSDTLSYLWSKRHVYTSIIPLAVIMLRFLCSTLPVHAESSFQIYFMGIGYSQSVEMPVVDSHTSHSSQSSSGVRSGLTCFRDKDLIGGTLNLHLPQAVKVTIEFFSKSQCRNLAHTFSFKTPSGSSNFLEVICFSDTDCTEQKFKQAKGNIKLTLTSIKKKDGTTTNTVALRGTAKAGTGTNFGARTHVTASVYQDSHYTNPPYFQETVSVSNNGSQISFDSGKSASVTASSLPSQLYLKLDPLEICAQFTVNNTKKATVNLEKAGAPCLSKP